LTRHPSLVLRLVRSAALWILPFFAICGLILTWVYQSSTLRIFDDPLESAITSLIASAQTGGAGQTEDELTLSREPLDPRYQRALSGRYWLIGYLQSTGEVEVIKASRSLYDEDFNLSHATAEQIMRNPGTDVYGYTEGPDVDERLRLVARSVILPHMNNRPVVMIAAADRRPAQQAIRRFGYIASGLFSLLSLGLVIGIFMQVRLGLKPLFDLREQVVGVREGQNSGVTGDYPAEIQPLARELNTLIMHNKDVVERARTHVGNLAHALKTPLAVLLNEVDRVQGHPRHDLSETPLAEIVGRQSEIMKNQVDHHLQRARAATRGQSIGAVTVVDDVITPLERTLTRIYGHRDIAFDVECEAGLIFRGEKRDLDELIGNLMDNACKWCKKQVRVRAHIDTQDTTRFTITVEDDGKGLSDTEYAQAMKRGIRLDETTPGTGFGLSIVDDLAKSYKGHFNLEKSVLGGLKAVLTLPGRL